MSDVTTDTLRDLKNLDEKIQKIYFLDREKYEYFRTKIENLRAELTRITNNMELKSILDSIVQLEYEYNEYLTHPNNGRLTLKNEGNNIIALKKHRINLFVEAAEMSYKGQVDPERIQRLRGIWEKEQKKLEYNSAEIDIVEEAFANMFLAYQIYYLNENDSMPKEKIENFCNVEHYLHELQDRVKEKLPKGDEADKFLEKEIEFAFLDGSLKELLENESVWGLLTGRKINKRNLQSSDDLNLEVAIEEENVEKEKTYAFPAAVDLEYALGNSSVILTLEKNSIFGNRVRKTKKIKVDSYGTFEIPFKIRGEVIEAIVPENAILELRRIMGLTDTYIMGAFEGCSNLEKVTLPNSLKRIDSKSFKDCKSLKEINIPSSVSDIASSAFANCISLESIELPDDIRKIEQSTFMSCENLKTVKLPNKLEIIGNQAFYGCCDLTHIEFPNKLRVIGSEAFSKSGLEEVIIPKSVTDIGSYIFSHCYYLKKAEILASTSEIPYHAFFNCSQLETAIFSKSIKKIGGGAFDGCVALKEILTPLENLFDFKINRDQEDLKKLGRHIRRIEKTKEKSKDPKDSISDEVTR